MIIQKILVVEEVEAALIANLHRAERIREAKADGKPGRQLELPGV